MPVLYLFLVNNGCTHFLPFCVRLVHLLLKHVVRESSHQIVRAKELGFLLQVLFKFLLFFRSELFDQLAVCWQIESVECVSENGRLEAAQFERIA